MGEIKKKKKPKGDKSQSSQIPLNLKDQNVLPSGPHGEPASPPWFYVVILPPRLWAAVMPLRPWPAIKVAGDHLAL